MLRHYRDGILPSERLDLAPTEACRIAVSEQGFYAIKGDGAWLECYPSVARCSPPGVGARIEAGEAGATCRMIVLGGPFWTRLSLRMAGSRSITVKSLSLQLCADETTWSGLLAWLASAFFPSTELCREESALAAEMRSTAGRIAVGRHRTSRGRSRGRLAERFRRAHDMRPVDYRQIVRASAAARLVEGGSHSLADVAVASGYASQSHMTAAFSAILGVTPAQASRVRPDQF